MASPKISSSSPQANSRPPQPTMLVDYSKRRAETTNDETNDGNLYRWLQVSPHWSQQRTIMERQIQAAQLAASNEGPDEPLQLARPLRRSLSPYQRSPHPNRKGHPATLRERSCSWDISSRYLPDTLDDAEEEEEEEEGSGDAEGNRPFPMDWSQPSQRTSTVAEKNDKEKLLSFCSWITKAANTLEEDSSVRSLNMVVPSRTTKTKEETTSNAKGSLSLSEIQKDCNSISSLSFEMRRRPNPVKQTNDHRQDDDGDDMSLCSAASARIRQSLLLQEPLNTLTRSRSMGMGACVTNSTSPVQATTTKRRALSPGNSTSHVRHRSLSPCHYYYPPSFQKEPQQNIPHKILLDFNASFASTKHTDWEDQSHSSRRSSRSSRRSSRASRQSKKDLLIPPRDQGSKDDPLHEDNNLPNISAPPIALTIPRPGALTLQQRQSSTEVQPGNLSDDNSIASSLDEEESDDSCTGAQPNFARLYTAHCPRKKKLPRRSLSVGANNHNCNNKTGSPLNILLSPTTATLRRSLSVDEPRRSSLSSSESSSKRRPRRISRTKSSSSKRGSLLLHNHNNPNHNHTIRRDSVRRCNSFVTGSRIRRHNNNDGTTTMDQPKGRS